MKELRLFESWADNVVGKYNDESLSTLVENMDDVGREYQHIEDLTYIQGPQGALKAIERLYQIAKDSSHLEVKWDGSPAITFGRNEQGEFHLGDKYAKEYLTTPKKLYEYVTRKSQSESRVEFANVMVQLFDYYKNATPAGYRGFLECGLMFPTSQQPKPDAVNGVYSFKPNTVIYNVSADSELGKRIGAAKTAAAATGYFKDLPGLGTQREAVGEHYRPIKSRDVVIIPPTFTNTQAKLPETQLKKLHAFVTQNAGAITNFITPDQAWVDTFKRNPAKAGTDWRAMIYKYVNSQVDNPGALEKLGDNMEQWAASDVILKDAGRRPIAINKIKQDKAGKKATFFVVKEIMKLKNVILNQIEKPTLASMGISATLPTGHQSGEGFVSDPHGGKNPLKLVNRAGFTAANRQQGGIGQARAQELGSKAKEALKEAKSNSDTAVVGFGRGMGHKGHMYLASAVITTAKEMNGDAFFFVSHTVGKDDPLTSNEKLSIYKRVFPNNKNIFKSTNTDNPNLSSILHNLYESGYKNVIVIVGEDQKQAFQYLTKYNGKSNKDGLVGYDFDTLKVISRQETNDPYAGEAGPRATPMRDILKDPKADHGKKFKVWRAAMPQALSDDEVQKLMALAAKRLGVPLQVDLDEGDNPNFFGFGGGSSSAIPGTPPDLQPHPTKRQLKIAAINAKNTKKFTQRRSTE